MRALVSILRQTHFNIILRPFEKFVDMWQCDAVMQREVAMVEVT
jgi:hypothetical protein